MVILWATAVAFAVTFECAVVLAVALFLLPPNQLLQNHYESPAAWF
jgi:hypothetical protein